MKLQYLGTAAAEGIPGLFCQCPMCQYARKTMGKEYRARSGAVVNDRLMIDFPPDVYATCLRVGDFYPLPPGSLLHQRASVPCGPGLLYPHPD